MNTGVFTFGTANLGDEMQSLAVLAHVDRVHTFVDRDHLADFDASVDTSCVFNSWFIGGDDFRRPADRIKPIWYGFCPGKDQVLEGEWLEFLKAHSPIGCRDLSATERLIGAGVEAYWTGCLTLFMGQALRRSRSERNGVYFVDVPASAEAHIPADIVRRAVRVSTFPSPGILDKPLQRWAAVAQLADLLAGAELVVTRRLHAALPAASFGTPVVAIPDPAISRARRRFAGFETIIPTVYLDEIEQLKRVDWKNLETRIPAPLAAHYEQFCQTLRSRGLAAMAPVTSVAALDDLGRFSQRLFNAPALQRPARMALRLRERTFELDVHFWCDRYVDVGLRGFPGLSKFEFEVVASASAQDEWTSWGMLRDLVVI